jgi:lipid II:glycine glycyltransferase (peptidoglycan interpeptide bridge formation enzyme)
MIRNKRTVTTYYFKIELGACISGIKDVIEAEEGLHRHHQQWYSTITGVNAEPEGPFGACAVGSDNSQNGMAYYLQQRGIYSNMPNHTVRNFVYQKSKSVKWVKTRR